MAGKSFPDFLKQNAGANAGFAALGVAADVASGDVGLKTILKTIRDLTIGTALWQATMVTAFGGMKKAVQGIVGQFTGFTDAMKKAREEFTKAQDKMGKGIAAPFEREEVENVKRMTQALKGLTPVAGDTAKAFHVIYGGASGARSEIAKFIGTSSVGKAAVGAFALAIGALAPIISGIAAIKLGSWFVALGGSMRGIATVSRTFGNAMEFVSMGLISSNKASKVAFSGLNALSGAMKYAKVAAAAFIGFELVSMIVNYAHAVRAAQVEAQNFAAEGVRSSNALRDQINGITTLTDKYNALAAALDAVNEANRQTKEAIESGNQQKANAAIANAAEKRRLADQAENAPTAPERGATVLHRDLAEQQRKLDFERRLSQATPEQRPAMLAAESARAGGLASKGQADVEKQDKKAGSVAGWDQQLLQNKNLRDQFEKQIAEEMSKPAQVTNLIGKYIPALQRPVDYAARDQNKIDYLSKNIRDLDKGTADVTANRNASLLGSGSDTMVAQAELNRIQHARDYKAAKDRSIPLLSDGSSDAARRQREGDMRISAAGARGYEKMPTKDLLRMQDEAKTKLELAQKTVTDVEANTAESFAAKNRKTDEAREELIAKLRVDTEVKIASIKERGYAMADEEHELKMKQLDRELKQEERNPARDQKKIDLLYGQRANLQTGQRNALEARATDRLDTNSELARQNMQLSGDARGIQGLDNSERYRKRYQEEFAKSGDAFDASAKATLFSNNSISLGARHGADAFDSAIKGDSLTRIFGGGNVAAGTGNSAVDIARQQKDAIEEGNKLLKIIADAVGAGDGDTLP